MSRRYMLDLLVNYEQQAKAAVLTPSQGQALALYDAYVLNRSGVAQDMGILTRLSNATSKFLTFVNPGPAVDATTAIQAGTTKNVFTTTNNDGFVVQSTKPFNLIGFNVTQAETGGPTYAYKYWNGASFAALPNIIGTPDYTTIGNKVIVFPSPRLWVAGTSAGVGGTSGLYTIFAQATTAPATAVQANDFWLGHMLAFMSQVPNNAQLSLKYDDNWPRFFDADEGLMPYFGVANAGNIVTAKYFNYG